MNRKGQDYNPLYLSLVILFVFGIIVPVVIAGFTDYETYDHNNYLASIIDFVANGVSLQIPVPFLPDLEVASFNPFEMLGDSVKDALLEYLVAFSYIHPVIAIPLIIFVSIGVIYTIVTMILP